MLSPFHCLSDVKNTNKSWNVAKSLFLHYNKWNLTIQLLLLDEYVKVLMSKKCRQKCTSPSSV